MNSSLRVPRSICVSNGYSYLNKGDAALALACFQVIRETYPSSTISFVSLSPEEDEKQYGMDGVKIVGRDLGAIASPDRSRVRKALTLAWRRLTNHAGTDYGEAIKNSDLVVACPGGYLNDGFGPAVFVHLEQLRCATRARIPIVLANQSVGPFHSSLLLRASRRALKAVRRAVIREAASERWALKLGLGDRMIRGSDLAFALKPQEKSQFRSILSTENGQRWLGVTVRDWTFPGSPDREAAQQNYLRAVADAIELAWRSEGLRPVFLPQVIGPGEDDDRLAARRVISMLDDDVRSHTVAIEGDLHPLQLRMIMRQLTLLLGTRMHSNIFALTEGVPVVAIAYEHKTTGIMAEFGLNDFVIDISAATGPALTERVQRALSDPQLRTHIMARIPGQASSAAKALQRAMHEALALEST